METADIVNPLAPYMGLIRLLAVGAAIAGVVWGIHALDQSRQQIGYDRRVAEDNAALLTAQEDARTKEQELNTKLEVARNEATQRQIESRRAADAARTASDRLRVALDTIRTTGNVPGNTGSAGPDTTATLAELLGVCTERYRSLAEKAVGHTNDVRTLSQGWPR